MVLRTSPFITKNVSVKSGIIANGPAVPSGVSSREVTDLQTLLSPIPKIRDEKFGQVADGHGHCGESIILQLTQHDLQDRHVIDWDQRLGKTVV